MPIIKAGRLVSVPNNSRIFGAHTVYKAVWVEDSNGGNERCLLFTEAQIKVAEERAKKNPEDLTKKKLFNNLFD